MIHSLGAGASPVPDSRFPARLIIAVPILTIILWLGGGGPTWFAPAAWHAIGIAVLAIAGSVILMRPPTVAVGPGDGRGSMEGTESAGRLRLGPLVALLTFVLVLVLSSLRGGHAVIGFRRVGVWIMLVAWMFLVARAAGSAASQRRGTALLAAVCATGCVIAVVHTLWRRGAPPRLPFDNPALTGALAAVSLPLLLALAGGASTRLRSAVWLILLIPTLGAAAASRSTAALLALPAGASTLACAWLFGRRSARAGSIAGTLAAVIVLSGLTLPLLIGSLYHPVQSSRSLASPVPAVGDRAWKSRPQDHLNRLRNVLKGRPDAAIAARFRIAHATTQALGEKPFIGFGPGAVPLTFARHRLQVPGESPPGEAVGQLHAVGLQRIYETGLLGLAGFASWVVLCLVGGRRESGGDALRLLRAGWCASVASLMVVGIVDALEGAPALVAVACTLLALLAAAPGVAGESRPPRWVAVTIGAGAILIGVIASVDFARVDLARRHGDRAVHRVRSAGFDLEVLNDLRAAARLDGAVGLYVEQAAYAAEELALRRQRAGDRNGAAALFDEAGSLYRSAADRFPEVPGFSSRMGNYLLDRDRPAEAIPYLRRGVALDYYDPLGHFYLGEALRLSGRPGEALDEYALAVRYYPRLTAAELWSAPGREERRRRVLEKVRDLLLAEIAAGDPGSTGVRVLGHVEALMAGSPDDEPFPRRRIILVHRLDAVPGRSRARHLFGRAGFPIENLPVTVLEADPAAEELRWSWVLEGLPVLVAADLESGLPARIRSHGGREGGSRSRRDGRGAGSAPRDGGMAG